jgi:N6-L-threonylcarbamoyladenine synthase
MKIFAIDTSADDTSAAVVENMRILSHVEYSQILLHQQWGGIYPSIAKRAHEERIDWVAKKALLKAKINDFSEIDVVAVTYGPGLAIALEVGLNYVKDIAKKYRKPFVGVNHMEGHLYSSFVKNSKGNPQRIPEFPLLGLLVSGGHTELVYWTGRLQYKILGETVDDAAGEALDKASRMLGFSYPGGPIIERLSLQVNNVDKFNFPRPMSKSKSLDFSFSGLKTALLYKVKSFNEEDLGANRSFLASSFQEAVFKKTKIAVEQTGVKQIAVGGGVSVNDRFRFLLRKLAKELKVDVYFPPQKFLNFDNAAMIGVVGEIRANAGLFDNIELIERIPRLSLETSSNYNMVL